MFGILSYLPLSNVVSATVGNDRYSPYRFHVINNGWKEGTENVVLEVFAGKNRLARAVWKDGLPNVYLLKAARQGRSKDILVAATCDGNQTQYSAVWLFSGESKRLILLAHGLDNADFSRLALGVVREENVDRWIGIPPREDNPEGWFHRAWTYDRKTRRLLPGAWRSGMLRH